MKKSTKFAGFSILLLFLIGTLFGMISVAQEYHEYSDELEMENFMSLDTAEDWFDGVETFFMERNYDSGEFSVPTQVPYYWVSTLEDTGTYLRVIESITDIPATEDTKHMGVLSRGHSLTGSSAGYYRNINEGYGLNITTDWYGTLVELWLLFPYSGQQHEFQLKNIDSGDYVGVIKKSDNHLYFYSDLDTSGIDCGAVSVETWYHLSFLLYSDSGSVSSRLELDGSYVDTQTTDMNNITEFRLTTTYVSGVCGFYLDAVGYQQVGIDLTDYSISNYTSEFRTQIKNQPYEYHDNYVAYTSDDIFSFESSLINKYPSADNNYRTELIPENIINENFIDPSRVLRLEGTGTIDNKYKVNQFYFTGINEQYDLYDSHQVPMNLTSYGASDTYADIGTITTPGTLNVQDSNNLTINGTEVITEDNYIGTYDFLDEEIGSPPTVPADYSTGGAYTQVITNYGVHNKPVQSVVPTFNTQARLYDSFSAQSSGTVEFWIAVSAKKNYVDLYLHSYCRIEIDSSYIKALHNNNQWVNLQSYSAGTWYHIRIDFDGGTNQYTVYINTVDKGTYTGSFSSINYFDLRTRYNTFSSYLDAIGYSWDPDYTVGDNYNPVAIPTQNSELNLTMETTAVDLISAEAWYDVSYYSYVDCNISSLDEWQEVNMSFFNYTSGEYQVIQSTNITDGFTIFSYTFVDLTDFIHPTAFTLNVSYYAWNYSTDIALFVDVFGWNFSSDRFYNSTQQQLRIRVDTFDSSDYLINFLEWNLDFNNTHGIITWNISYRESLASPIWHIYPTNPIFKFEDYLQGQDLETLQINAHFFLTEHSGQKWLYIRTQVCFNDLYNSIYEYDKIIDLGDSTFYDSQQGLRIRYIDYFNPNPIVEYYDYVWTPYTRSNMQGYRQLQLNSSDTKYNFLDCGFYKTNLIYYEPPPEPNPPVVPDPEESERPPGADYYQQYTTFSVVSAVEDVDVGNWTYEFYKLHANSFTAKYWFDWDAIAYINADTWGNWGFFGEWNWLRNGIAFICNIGIGILNLMWLGVQYILFGLVIAFQWIIMYLVVGIVFCEGIWNIGFYWLIYAFIAVGWLIWLAAIVLWEDVFIPFLEWLFETGLPLIIDILIVVIAAVLAFLVWLFTLGQGDYDAIFSNIESILSMIADTLIEMITLFIIYLPYFLVWTSLYIVLCFLLYCKYLYFRFKGFNEEAQELFDVLQTFLTPIRIVLNMIARLRGAFKNE